MSSYFKKALEKDPNNLDLLRGFVAALIQEKDFAKAETVYRSIIEQDPEDRDARLGLATAFFHLKRFGEALVIIEDLLAQDILVPESYLLQAKIELNQNKKKEAIATYKKARDLNPLLVDETFENMKLPAETLVEAVDQIRPEMGGETTELEKPKLSFQDVGGMNELKEEIKLKIIHPFQFPELYKAYQKSAGGGILLYGPPGCGKTHIARATAGEIKGTFVSVDLSDVLDMYIGESERKLHEIFATARRRTPAILFFDEVDALGASRFDLQRSAGRHLINQFLAELDGSTYSNEGILILGATNMPWHVDSAFRRPGRFDRIIFVPPPDEEARKSILELLLRGKPCEDLDIALLAEKTPLFSGADLMALVDKTVEAKLQESLKLRKAIPLTMKDFLRVLPTIESSLREWFATAKNYATYANQGGTYDQVMDYLRHHRL